MRDSQTAGQIRSILLNTTYDSNPWVVPFYAPHTFEIDFALNLNTFEIKAILPSIYKRQSDIDKSTKKLNSEDKSIVGKEALRLANKEGKGWFALLVSEQLSYETVIPEYILEAIAFTSEHIKKEHLIAMAQYRIKRMSIDLKVDINEMTFDELFEMLLPENDGEREDDLIRLVKLLGVELGQYAY